MKKYITEFIGTFFLVLTIGMAVNRWCGCNGAPGNWFSINGNDFCRGHISGGHYNPAVTLAVLMKGKITLRMLWLISDSQLVGSLWWLRY